MKSFDKSYDSIASAAKEILEKKNELTEGSAEVTISVDLADILTEKLRAGRGKTTVDADYMTHDKYFTNVSQRKFKIKIKPTGSSTADITGEKKDIIAFLQSDDYGLDDRDIKDLFPELLESLTEAFRDSVEATDYMERILGTLKNRNLESWAVQTDRNYSVKSVKALKKATDAYNDFLELMYSVDEALTEGESLTEAKIEVPTDEKDIKAFLDKAKKLRATEKDFNQSTKPLDLKTFAKFDKLARDHKDYKGAYELGYDAGMGYDLPKGGGLEGNNPHKKNTFAYYLWMDIAGQGASDA